VSTGQSLPGLENGFESEKHNLAFLGFKNLKNRLFKV